MTDGHARALSILSGARKAAREDRGRLLLETTDFFSGESGKLSAAERRIMLDILGRLLRQAEREICHDLSERLSRNPDAPRELICLLAGQEIDIAGAVLRYSRVLQNEDLIEIIHHRTRDHQLMVAMREGLETDVTDALVATGDEGVIETLLRNPEAELAEQTIAYLVEESRNVDTFREPLSLRDDLPPELAARMFWWVSGALRRELLLRLGSGEEELDDAIISAARKLAADRPERRQSEAERLVRRMDEWGELTARSLLSLLRSGHVGAFMEGLALMAGTEASLARRIVHSGCLEALATLCKAARLGRNEFSSIWLLLRRAEKGGKRETSGELLARVLEFYDVLDGKKVRLALGYWAADRDFFRIGREGKPEGGAVTEGEAVQKA